MRAFKGSPLMICVSSLIALVPVVEEKTKQYEENGYDAANVEEISL